MIRLGIIGDSRVAHSLSPHMHTYVLRRLGLEGSYEAFALEPGQVAGFLKELPARGLQGLNVTVPHKREVIPSLDELDPGARALGAANTIINDDGRLLGYNTDLGGFMDAVSAKGIGMSGKRALVFGAGGAARAVVAGLLELGAGPVSIAARDPQKAAGISPGPGAVAIGLDQTADVFNDAALLVNATSVSAPAESPEMHELVAGLKPGPGLELVMDINYGRADNFWADLARRAGAGFQDGLAMLAAQAARSFSLWTGQKVDAALYMQALEERP